MKVKPVVSVIIVSFNTKEVTLSCLDSVYRFTKGVDFEVIVVDNGSQDGSIEALSAFEAKNKNFKLIKSSTNLGFGRANNLGAKEAEGEYLLFLNSDTLLTEDAISHSVEKIKKDKKITVYSTYLLNKDLSVQPSGGHFPTLTRLLTWQFFFDDLPFIGDKFTSIHPHTPGFFFLDKLSGKKPTSTDTPRIKTTPDWVTGAFMLIGKDRFWEVGGFDEAIFMYTEEMELCYRLKKSGGTVVLDPDSSIIHLGGASGGSFLALTAEVSGMLYFFKKHKASWQLPPVKLIFLVGSLLRYLIFGIIGRNATARASYSAILRHLT